MIRVSIPYHLKTLARIQGEIHLHVNGSLTIRSILDALEAQFPVLKGTIRDQVTRERRPFLRFFACGNDISLEPDTEPLPEMIQNGTETLLIVGAMAGG